MLVFQSLFSLVERVLRCNYIYTHYVKKLIKMDWNAQILHRECRVKSQLSDTTHTRTLYSALSTTATRITTP